MTVPELFPRPRHVDRFDPAVSIGAPVDHRRDPTLPGQGFELTVDMDGARLLSADPAGRRYGDATVDQLRRADGSLPVIRIRDWPDFATRGFMLDVSRDRVPTRATLTRLVERLAVCRYNQFQLYIEHTFAFQGHRKVWSDASPITPGDLSWLDETCEAVGIELVINQNTFGHFGRWLAHPDYRQRAECPEGFEIAPGFRLPPSVLAPTEENAAFARTLVREQLACVKSDKVNVGCDETFELGKGVSADRVAAHGLGALYAEHLHRIIDPLLADGCEVQFWADVALKHPEILTSMDPERCTPIVWNYDAPDVTNPTVPDELRTTLATIGIDLDLPTDFETILEPLAERGHPFWVAPGTSTWQSLIGRWPNARENLTDAARAGLAAGATGYLVTDWGDSGHLQPHAVSLPPIVHGGAMAWCGATNQDLDVATIIDDVLVGDASGQFGATLTTIGSLDGSTGLIARNASPLFQAVSPSLAVLTSGAPDPEGLSHVLETLARARSDLAGVGLTCKDGNQLIDELDIALGLARHGAQRLFARSQGNNLVGTHPATELAELIVRYRRAWLASSRPGGLDDSVAGLERTLARERSSS